MQMALKPDPEGGPGPIFNIVVCVSLTIPSASIPLLHPSPPNNNYWLLKAAS